MEPQLTEALLELAEQALAGEQWTGLETAAEHLRDAAADDPAAVARVDALLVSMRRSRAEHDALQMNERRLAEAQRVGAMGSYDWEIASDTNSWSDELFRIYGTEPQSFNASYEKFMEFIHPDDRERVKAVHAEAFATCEPYTMEERIVRADGEVRVLSTTGEVATDAEGRPARIYGICRDVTEHRRAEEEARRRSEELHDAALRRRHALEINDNVVQGLSAALYALESGLDQAAVAALRSTVHSARLMMNDLLADAGDDRLCPGDLVRAEAVTATLPLIPEPTRAVPSARPVRRVLLVDDALDIRLLLRRILDCGRGFEVVGEAGDGRSAIAMAEKLAPDVIILDLAMPFMDGLEALPLLRAKARRAKIVVLSGFDRSRMQRAAVDAGADAYLEKGGNLAMIINTLDELLPRAG